MAKEPNEQRVRSVADTLYARITQDREYRELSADEQTAVFAALAKAKKKER